MTDFTKLREMIDRVDAMPEGTKFKYESPYYCLFGLGTKGTAYEGVCGDLLVDTYMVQDLGITKGQGETIYYFLTKHMSKEGTECRDRHACCALVRELIAKWETQQCLTTVASPQYSTAPCSQATAARASSSLLTSTATAPPEESLYTL